MNIKYMRALLIFDLPTLNAYERKEYRKFRKFLIRQGYIMIQFSVYVKAFNGQIKTSEEVKKFADVIPKDGNIRIIKVTEHQWQDMVYLLGERNYNEVINNNERYIKI